MDLPPRQNRKKDAPLWTHFVLPGLILSWIVLKNSGEMHYYFFPIAIFIVVALMLRPERKEVKIQNDSRNPFRKNKSSVSGFRVMAEYGSSGIWAIGNKAPFRHGMVEHSALQLPPEICDRFVKWIQTY